MGVGILKVQSGDKPGAGWFSTGLLPTKHHSLWAYSAALMTETLDEVSNQLSRIPLSGTQVLNQEGAVHLNSNLPQYFPSINILSPSQIHTHLTLTPDYESYHLKIKIHPLCFLRLGMTHPAESTCPSVNLGNLRCKQALLSRNITVVQTLLENSYRY